MLPISRRSHQTAEPRADADAAIRLAERGQRCAMGREKCLHGWAERTEIACKAL